MKSTKELANLLNLNLSFENVLLPVRYHQNVTKSSIYNETITTLFGVNVRKVHKNTLPFTQIKEYLKVCLVEHLIMHTRYQDSVAMVDSCDTTYINQSSKRSTPNKTGSQNSSNSTKKASYRNSHIEGQLDNLAVYIENFEIEFLSRPYCCVNCGLRFLDLDELNKHSCRVIGLMSHMCSCGDVFNDHALFIKHIRPNKVNYFSKSLLLPKCKWITLHYLFLWLKLVIKNKQEFKFNCNICDIKFTNFISWLAHYYDCLNNDHLTCCICADNINKTCDESYSYIRSIFIPMKKIINFKISLKDLSQFFINVKLNETHSAEDIMSSIGFNNLFYFELNTLLQQKLNFKEIQQYEDNFYKHRIKQLIEFFRGYPDVCQNCFSRINESTKCPAIINSSKRHKCKKVGKDQHICLCSARFSNHENYVFHQIYRCQFLVFVHICLMMVLSRVTTIHSLCKAVCVPMHNLPHLREHWKKCKECHFEWIKNCSFCSDGFKEKFDMNSNNYDIYFKRLLAAKDLVMRGENKLENEIGNSSENNETNLICLKSGPPFSLVSRDNSSLELFDP